MIILRQSQSLLGVPLTINSQGEVLCFPTGHMTSFPYLGTSAQPKNPLLHELEKWLPQPRETGQPGCVAGTHLLQQVSTLGIILSPF